MSSECVNCGATLKTGLLSSNEALPGYKLQIINAVQSDALEGACNKCGDDLFKEAAAILKSEDASLKQAVRSILPTLPVVSIHSPVGWEYDVIGMVTAQSVTGTGIFSDVASAFTDLFGTQSGTYNAKIREGENLCRVSLRAQAIELGGNAIVAADIDYAEVGGQRAMLMVCMTGTAVKITNPERIGPDFGSSSERGAASAARIRQLEPLLKLLT